MTEITYKVLIADDEYWTREKLRTMIDWKQYNIEFLEPAVDGEDVLKKIEENMPDILITDINMPFIDGVELIKIIKEKYPAIVVFVISGYDDFDFVKSTLLNGAINYMLKPVTKIDLVNTLSKSLEIISSRIKLQQEQEEQRLQILKAASSMKDRELSLLVEKEEARYSPVVMMNSNFDFAGYSLILIKIHNLSELTTEYGYDINLLSYWVKKQIRELTGLDNLLIFNYIYRSNEFIIITELENSKLRRMALALEKYFNNKMKAPVSIVISEHSYSIESIHTAYIQSVSMLMTRRYKNSSVVLFCEKDNPELHKDVKNCLTEEQENTLKTFLNNKNQSGVIKLIFETIGLGKGKVQEWSYLEVKQSVKRICNVIMEHQLSSRTHKEIMELESLAELVNRTVEYLNIDHLQEALEEMIDYIIDLRKDEISSSIRDVVKNAIKYIDQNYFEDLSLASLAEQFNVESSYFSKIFRQETGDNLMLYIAKKRMNKCVEYMADAKISLTEIAFMVGYDDYSYFNRVFRKMMGSSPSEYRNELMLKK
ncbi:MAG: response regulator [Mobilitalea sp.]